ncbi:transcriptional regulator GlxA family with amidase domain [Kitasatospora sp. MAP12-15]|uniref:GlxA family transcriptional regulator n=1 Tax=unclassified Kitasatospora TaxID=2633591 RepID=UPI002473E909|nr:helix-turn-helix domain-containing protein [Kitasatospora sp. MAP12-44]MDH6113815.1 transcriptional regulator GlxA family with amidase domain [Kitasatospora sp. MAP12-44]
MTTDARRVVIAGYRNAELLDIACVSDTFDAANRLGADPPYQVRLATVRGQPVPCSSGLVLAAQSALEKLRGPLDTLLVAGGLGHRAAAADPELISQVRRLAAVSRRVGSVCTGADVLAAAGLLDGRRVTTHWAFAAELADTYPAVRVDPAPIHIRDGAIYTSAGVTSALDLALSFVEDDHGPGLARSVARQLVTYLQRPGNQAQVSMFTAPVPTEHRAVRRLVRHITAHPADDLGAPALAARAGLSTRQLSRIFADQLGKSPAEYVRSARAEAAARLIGSTTLPLAVVARQCGFGSTETLRQAFLSHYGVSPSAHRAACRTAARSDPGDRTPAD